MLVGSLCCKNRDRREIPVEECLEHCLSGNNYCGTPYELQRMLFEGVQDRKLRLSTTSILDKCDRQEWYKRKTDYAVDPATLYSAQRGTLIHAKMESHQHPRMVAEHRYIMDLDEDSSFSCQPDLIDPVNGVMSDYKSAAETPVFDYPWPDHKMQLFVNRWVVDNAHTVVTPDGEAIDLRGPEREKYVPREWTKLVVVYLAIKNFKPIACTRSIQVEAKGGGFKNVRVPDIGDDDEIESFVRTRYMEVSTALQNDEPPSLTEKYRTMTHPLCQYCPFREDCFDTEVQRAMSKRLEDSLKEMSCQQNRLDSSSLNSQTMKASPVSPSGDEPGKS